MQSHLVQRISFDLHLTRAREAAAVQQRVSSFSNGRLPLILERCLVEYGDGAASEVLERVELDLGILAPATLEGQLAERIAHALRDQLARHRHRQRRQAAPPAAAAPESPAAPAAVLARYFETGAAGEGGFDLDGVLAALASSDPALLGRLLRRHGQRHAVRKRLATQLGLRALERLVMLLEPAHGELIVACAHEAGAVRLPRLAQGADRRGLGRAVWEFILAYLLVERGSHFNTRAFAASLLRQMAGRYRIAYAELLDALAALPEAGLPFSARASLPGLLAELRHDVAPAAAPANGLAPLAQFASYLRHGSCGGWAQAGGAAAALEQLLDQQPDALRELLLAAGTLAPARRRLACQMPEPLLVRVVVLLEPQEARHIRRDLRAMTRLHDDQALVAGDAQGFARMLWQLVFDYLLCERGSHFNRRSFIKSVLAGMAARSGVAYGVLLGGVLQHLPLRAAHGAGHDTLAGILLALSDELWLAGDVTAPHPQNPCVGQLASALDGLLPPGRPWLADAAAAGPPGAAAWLRAVLAAACTRFGLAYRDTLLRLAARTSGAARAVCRLLLAEMDDAAQANPPAPKLSALEAALYLIVHGSTAPGASADAGAALDAMMRDPERAAAALRAVGLRPEMIRRLPQYLRPAALDRIVRALDPAGHGLHAAWLAAGAQLGAAAGALHWQLLLEQLLDADAGPVALAQLAARCAARLGLDAAAYREALGAALAPGDAAGVLKALEAMPHLPRGAVPMPQQATHRLPMMPDHAGSAAAVLQSYLQYGAVDGAAGPLAAVDAALAQQRQMVPVLVAACGHAVERGRLARLMAAGRAETVLALLVGYASGAVLRLLRALAMHPGRWWSEASLIDLLLASIHRQRGRRFDPGIFVQALLLQAPAGTAQAQARLVRRLRHDFDGRHGVADKALLKRIEWAGRALALRDLPRAPAPASKSTSGDESAVPAEVADGDAFIVANAGLVLLWPFLQGYFGGLGMLAGQAFDGAAQERAPHLLQMLASGETAMSEEGMLLNKILCGIDPSAALGYAEAPTEAETALAEQLLHSVTQHWSMLKNTTLPLLRSTFLMREGRLVKRPEVWSLVVASGPYDMLLQSLPWGLSSVRLPWMQGVIFVEWKR